MKKKNASAAVFRTAAVGVFSFILCLSQVLFGLNRLIADPLFQSSVPGDRRIRIVAIDEKTIAAYGDPSDWTREIPARLVRLLNENKAAAPALIIFDVMYVSERDSAADAAFAEACREGGNVITAANLVYRMRMAPDGSGYRPDWNHVQMVEYPYGALHAVSDCGFANALIDRDQFVREAQLYADFNGERLWSLPAAAAIRLAERAGETPALPETDAHGRYLFTYTGKNLGHGGPYSVISLCDVLDGKIDLSDFGDSVVFVGAYAAGLQDSFNAAVQRGSQMYGVEIHANILQAILEQRTAIAVPPLIAASVTALYVTLYLLAIRRMHPGVSALLGAGMIAAFLASGRILFDGGLALPLIDTVFSIVVVFLLHLVGQYLGEILRRRRILKTFRQYVAPQIVDEVAAKGDFSVCLGGERRQVAVLFVDIRGFTAMSEALQPEQVVEILNEFLSLATDAIFRNGGTLDKFIGDATMAVFNAPFDLDDYVYRAVCTARDIVSGGKKLGEELFARYGRRIGFGIGVNCGEAVVGNIGCEFRMDYTAIGDTVNTAARLESRAEDCQILIGEPVYEAVKDRVRVTERGSFSLKGKSRPMQVYQLDEVD